MFTRLLSHKRFRLPRILKGLLYLIWILLFIEISARLAFSIKPVFRRINGIDASWQRIQWIKQHDNGKQFVYRFDVYDPIRGWGVMPNVSDMHVFEGKILNTNSRGIRGSKEYSYDRQPGKKRIIVLGDSYTFGDEVSDDETYCHYLEGILPNTEVLNLGVHGYGHDQMLLYLKEEGVKYQPDIVVLGFVWFDMIRNLFNFNNYAKPRYEPASQGLRLTNVPVPRPETVLEHEIYRSKALDAGIMLLEKCRWRFGINRKREEELTRAILDLLVKTVHECGAVPVFVYLPVLSEISNPDERLTINERYLLDYCNEREVRCLQLRPYFARAKKNGMSFTTNHHWFANGHMTAARGISDFFMAEGLIPRQAGSATQSKHVVVKGRNGTAVK